MNENPKIVKTFSISLEELRKVKQFQERNRLTFSQLIRNALRLYMNSHPSIRVQLVEEDE